MGTPAGRAGVSDNPAPECLSEQVHQFDDVRIESLPFTAGAAQGAVGG